MNDFYQRKSPRIQGYDYSTENYYFITICANKKSKVFGEPQKLNIYGKIAEEGFLKISEHFENVYIDKFVIMPNHVHAIVVVEKSTNLTTVIGQYKSFVTRKIHEHQPNLVVWQRSFHDHIIRNKKSYEKIWNYIDTNPMKWSEDCFFE